MVICQRDISSTRRFVIDGTYIDLELFPVDILDGGIVMFDPCILDKLSYSSTHQMSNFFSMNVPPHDRDMVDIDGYTRQTALSHSALNRGTRTQESDG